MMMVFMMLVRIIVIVVNEGLVWRDLVIFMVMFVVIDFGVSDNIMLWGRLVNLVSSIIDMIVMIDFVISVISIGMIEVIMCLWFL